MTIFNRIVYSSYANRCKIAESSRLSSHIFKSNLRAMRNYCGADFIAKCSMNNSDARWLSPCILIFRDYVFPYFEENPATHQHKNLKTYALKRFFYGFVHPIGRMLSCRMGAVVGGQWGVVLRRDVPRKHLAQHLLIAAKVVSTLLGNTAHGVGEPSESRLRHFDIAGLL